MSLQQALAETHRLVAETSPLLSVAEQLLNVDACLQNERKVAIDDLYAFAILRNLAMVKELHMPACLSVYIQRFSDITGIPLYPQIGCADFDLECNRHE